MTVVPEAEGNTAIELYKNDSHESEFKPDWRFYLIFLSLAIITLAASLDATSLSVALPIMASKLHGSAIEAFWAGTSFLLSSTVIMPSYGSLSHIFGRKPLLITALVCFLTGSVTAAVANNFVVLLVGRSWQGIGAGGIITLTEIIITDLVPLQERGKWYGLISAVWSVGSVSGPIIGGVFAQSVSWRWIFWMNLPITGIGFTCVILFLKQRMTRQDSLKVQLCRVDWFGTILFIGATTSLLIPITWGGVMYPWSSPRTLIPFIIGILGLGIFGPYEYYISKEPMVRLSVFNNPTSCIVYFQAFLHGVVLWSLLYYGPFFFEGVRGYSPVISGVAMFPETFTIAPVAAFTGIIVCMTGKYRWALWGGWVLTCAGFGFLYMEDAKTPISTWVPLNLVPGVGMGMLFTSMALAIPAACNPIDMAHAVSVYTFFRVFGNCVGVAISGAVFQNQIKLNLLAYPLLASLAETYSEDAAALVEIIKVMENSPLKDQILQAYADSLKTVWVTMSALSGLALLSNFWVKAYTLQQSLVTEQGFLDKKKPLDAEESLQSHQLATSGEQSFVDLNEQHLSHGASEKDIICDKNVKSKKTSKFSKDKSYGEEDPYRVVKIKDAKSKSHKFLIYNAN
ncbi:Efflux pump FUS6 [Erysiphe neolycopersici]|uniref:Efflux pump FUS6 n=1 Tax=Erysiphe neolycopersici TaxID=212602 RepID=A0A420HSR0_9PEZI|nr:Efflux pump FUS6 [Erysiphe neolycopersici]